MIHVEHSTSCCDALVPHVHVPKIDEFGYPIQVVWDEPQPPEDPVDRRLRALEVNVQNIWEHLNARAASHE